MNMPVHPSRLSMSRQLSPEELQAFGAAIEALYQQTRADLGQRDADYIYRVRAFVRYSEMTGRGLLMLGGWIPPVWLTGTVLLGMSKIVENMELGHNVMHGQYDWMNDPSLNGARYDWDNVCAANAWKHTHNYEHHTYTNIVGKDRDLGYGTLRISEKQRWYPQHRYNLLFTAMLALGFEWFVGVHDMQLDRYIIGKRKWRDLTKTVEWQEFVLKARRQVFKDYVFFPVIAGINALPVLTGNLSANLIRNVWAWAIIFCGHFTEHAEVFEDKGAAETRAEWFVRQIRGSSNISGGALMDFFSGNLSHQIEHHLFPDLPANRYKALAPQIRALCEQYGQHYNTGSFAQQLGTVLVRLTVMSVPDAKRQGLERKVDAVKRFFRRTPRVPA
jgi:fatty acid desaturase